MQSRPPIPILFLIDKLSFGGTEKQLVQLIQSLDPKKFEPHVCTLKKSEGFLDELEVPGVLLNFTSFTHISIFSKVCQFISYVRCNRIQIIQTFFQDSFLLAGLGRPFYSAKLVGSFRDLGFWRNFSEKLKMRLCLPIFNGFIANSEAVKGYYVKEYRLDPGKIEVIYNGFDSCCFSNIYYCRKKTKVPVVGIVANLNRPVKKVDDFLYAAALIHKKFPKIRFCVVGGGQLQPQLESLSKSLNIDHVMTFTGRVNNPLDYIKSFSVGVITSETEGFCNAILEYMACGLPVVATDAGGNPELVKDNINGFLVPVGDIGLIAEKILTLLSNNLNSEICEVNSVKILKEFSLAAMAMRHQSYYETILKG